VREVPDELGLPLIVKPPREGSSIGITKVIGYSQMADAVQLAALRPRRAVRGVHRGHGADLPGAGQGAAARALPVVRIAAPDGNYDYQNKYFSDDTGYLCPSGLPATRGRGAAPDAGRLPRAGLPRLGPCRPDAAAPATARPFLLEMNTSPGMTGHSLVPMSARAAGIGYEQLCLRLLAAPRWTAAPRRQGLHSHPPARDAQRHPPCRCRTTCG
jgi:D-alanine-D-alanine ligase